MSPLDDELRAALQGRADAVSPSPDPLAGIERRAARMRRNRVALSVAGSVLAVAAVAAVVPALQSSARPAPGPLASAVPTEAVTTSSYVLDPANPWEPRGLAISEDDRAMISREYAARTGADRVLVTPLYAGTYEAGALTDVVFLAAVDGSVRWGVASYPTDAGAEIVWDAPLPEPAVALAAALPGDEAGTRLVVVAAPDVGRVEYGPDGAREYTPLNPVEPGVAVGALEGDPATDQVRVVGPDGEEVFRGPAPDLTPETATEEPANLLSTWPVRGDRQPDLEARVTDLFAQGVGEVGAVTQYRPLFTGDTDRGVRYTVGQAWTKGGDAHTVALSQGGTSGEQFFLGAKTDPDVRVVAAVVCCQPGSSVDTLVVVPVPGTGQVLYGGPDDLGPVGAEQDHLDGVVLVDRDPRTTDDRLRLLDGDGDPAEPLFDGAVFDLLCGLKGCG